MDFFSLLLLIVFIVLPLVQEVLKRRRPPPRVPGEDLPGEPHPQNSDRDLQAARERAIELRGDGQTGGWSGDWGEWPDEGEAGDEAVPVLREAAPPPLEREPAPRAIARVERVQDVTLEVLPEQHPPPPLVISLEPTRIDRAAEHQRFHDKVYAAAVPLPPRPALARDSFAALLRDQRGVRRAIIVSEVLGPPRALQPLEGGEPR